MAVGAGVVRNDEAVSEFQRLVSFDTLSPPRNVHRESTFCSSCSG